MKCSRAGSLATGVSAAGVLLACLGWLALRDRGVAMNGFESAAPPERGGDARIEVRSHQGIPLHEGRRRDQIRPIDEPRFVWASAAADRLRADDWVVGVVGDGVAKAYPLWVLRGREIVNDRIGREGICVTYCPLSGSVVVFASRVDGRDLTFGNEGALYECNLVLYDRETESLWYQLRGTCIGGVMLGRELSRIPAAVVRWNEWRRQFPETGLLTADGKSGFFYRVMEEPAPPSGPTAPVSIVDGRMPAMEEVIGFRSAGREYCLRAATLREWSEGLHPVHGGAGSVSIRHEGGIRRVLGSGGEEIANVPSYWFAWRAAFPDGVFLGENPRP